MARVEIRYHARGALERPVFAVAVSTLEGTMCYETSTHADDVVFPPLGNHGVVVLVLEALDLGVGAYRVDAASGVAGHLGEYLKAPWTFPIGAPTTDDGAAQHPHHWEIEPAGEGLNP